MNRADYMQGTSLKFKTEQAAIDFCDRQGVSRMSARTRVPLLLPC